MNYPFVKMQGIGNDFVVFDTFTQPLTLSLEQIRYIADRNFGIGCDQVLLLEPSNNDRVDVHYRIFNADGSEVMQCGNGARCAAVYLKERGLINKQIMIAGTGAGQLLLQIEDTGAVTVNMGVPEFDPLRIPMNRNTREDHYQLTSGENKIEFSGVSMGNPHAVIIVDDVDVTDVSQLGSSVQQSGLFPDGVNVGFIELLNRQAFKLRVYERGSRETLACGSGACAAMVVACHLGYLDGTVDAELRGGHLRLHWAGEGESVYMTGPATTVFEGTINL